MSKKKKQSKKASKKTSKKASKKTSKKASKKASKKTSKKEEKKPITITAYARHRKEKGLKGGTHQAIKKAIDSARLLTCLVEVGNKKLIVSTKEADLEWESKTTPETQIDQNDPKQAELSLETKETSNKYQGARARRLDAQAELAEIELAKAKGEVLDLNAARNQITTIGKELSQGFSNISRSRSAEFAAETNPQVIRNSLQDLLKDLVIKTIKKLQGVVPNE